MSARNKERRLMLAFVDYGMELLEDYLKNKIHELYSKKNESKSLDSFNGGEK